MLVYAARSTLALLQLIFAITVCGLYGKDVDAVRKAGEHQDGRWIFAVVVGGLSAVTALVYMIPKVFESGYTFAWDLVLAFLWVVVFGIFGKLYIPENCEGNASCMRLKNAVWIDLVNMLLCIGAAAWAVVMFLKYRRGMTKFTGRARAIV